MFRLSIVAAAAVLSALAATPVSAQEVFRNPGAYAFTNPYRDVLNGGKPTPALKLASDPAAMQAYAARESGIGRLNASAAVNQGQQGLSAYRQTLASASANRKYRHHR
jgi:hypothetical protein